MASEPTGNKVEDNTLAFDGSQLKMEMQTQVKIQEASWAAGVMGETSVSSQPFGNGQPSGTFSGSKVEVEVAAYSSYSANLKYSDGKLEVGNFNSCNSLLWKEEPERELKAEKLTLFLRTATKSCSNNSKTFKLNVKAGCSLGKVKANVARVLKVAEERIVLKTKGRRCLNDSTLVQEIQDCIITACIV